MSDKNTGGPAFPLQSIGPEFPPGYAGMTLRDYFAAKAMQGAIAFHGVYEDELLGEDGVAATQSTIMEYDIHIMAKISYAYADAMLRARENT